MDSIEFKISDHEQRLKRSIAISGELYQIEKCLDAIIRNMRDGTQSKTIVADFLLLWDSIGTDEIKKECSEIAINAILGHLRDKKTDLQNEFNNL